MFVTAANKESICAENNVIQVELRQLSYFLPVANVGKRSDEHVPTQKILFVVFYPLFWSTTGLDYSCILFLR